MIYFIVIIIVQIIIFAISIFKESSFAYFKKRAEIYATKKDLKEITKIVEDVKCEIQNKINEHEIKFSKIHNDRAEFLKDLYGKLYNLFEQLEYYCEMMTCTDRKEKSEYLKKSFEMLYNIKEYYETNSILVDDKVDILVSKLFKTYEDTIKTISDGANITIRYYSGQKFSDKVLNEGFEKIETGFKMMKGEIKEINDMLKNEFKKILN